MQVSERVQGLIEELTLEEKCLLTAGHQWWSTEAVPRLGVHAAGMTDAANGARGPYQTYAGPHTSACVPCETALGATWDPDLVEEVGALVAEEARSKGSRVLLAPMVNLHRSPLAGRNFECFSEDPLLTAAAAVAYIRGAQSRGVACTVKHFVANEAETERNSMSSEVDERTLRELYLPPFEAAVREGGVLGIMTGYNRLNGTWCAEHAELLAIPREEWGFEGFIVSDWGAVGSTVGAVRAGLDVEMPGPGKYYGSHLREAVERGEVTEAAVDGIVGRLLSVLEKVGALDEAGPEPASVDLPAHRELTRRAAAAATVLLRNEGILPLQTSQVRSIAVLGPNAEAFAMMGGGSAAFNPHDRVTPVQALKEAFPGARVVHEPGVGNEGPLPPISMRLTARFTVTETDEQPLAEVVYAQTRVAFPDGLPGTGMGPYHLRAAGHFTVDHSGWYTLTLQPTGQVALGLDGVPLLDSGMPREPGRTPWVPLPLHVDVELAAGEHELVLTSSLAPGEAWAAVGFRVGLATAVREGAFERAVAAAADADVAVVMVGTDDNWETEFVDRDHMGLRGRQDELVERVLQANPNTVVVLNTGTAVALPWADRAPALLQSWFGGQEMSRALVDVLTGQAEPGGRLPITLPRRLQDTPTFGSFPGESGVHRYTEGVFVGYRWYESRDVAVAFPFGHGLSYTSFDLGQAALSVTAVEATEDLEVQVRFTVTNTGKRTGSEVVQCYVEPPPGRHQRPTRELRAFRKVLLEPGASTDVVLTLGARAFSRWAPAVSELDRVTAQLRAVGLPEVYVPDGPAEGQWQVDAGTYRIHLGRSVADLPQVLELRVTAV